jgi:hypothetical protein
MGRDLKRTNKRTFAVRVSRLVLIEEGDRVRGNVGKECRVANVGGERVDRDLIASSVAAL